MKILVTGFDPFGGESINPSSEVVRRLPKNVLDAEIIPLIVPTMFQLSISVIEEAILKYDPDVIVSIGQAGGRNAITVERIGINVDDARIPDNAGVQRIDEPVVSLGPAAYFSTLPIKAMVQHIQNKGIHAAVSNTAGTFVCNHVMYGVLHLCATKYKNKRAGFIHIPYLIEQTQSKPQYPSMSLEDIITGIIASLEAIVLYDKDIKVTAGQEH
ncbi:MAG: pyroglutamyl-peptidase I [Erysipelotrichaceae bacterium]|nr:pyroglutamyl-peptidase I [Erysipelotrichaceae bacterium]